MAKGKGGKAAEDLPLSKTSAIGWRTKMRQCKLLGKKYGPTPAVELLFHLMKDIDTIVDRFVEVKEKKAVQDSKQTEKKSGGKPEGGKGGKKGHGQWCAKTQECDKKEKCGKK